MPKFDKQKSKELDPLDEKIGGALANVKANIPDIIQEPRCRVCQSPHRHYIDGLLAKGYNYSAIAKQVPSSGGRKLDRRSVGRHAKNHMDVESGAIRELLEHEAEQAGQNFVEGVRGAITHRGILEVTLRKAYERIMNGETEVEARDLIQIVTTLQKLDQDTGTVQVDQMRAELNAFLQAIREVVPEDYWPTIANRARQIARGDIGDLSEDNVPELVEGEVVS